MEPNTKPVVFDSNIWIALFIASDTQHQKASRLVQQYKDVAVMVPEYVLLETLTIIKLQTTHEAATACLDRFLHTEGITVLPAATVYTETIALFQTMNEPHLSFVDLSLLALSRTYEVQTFDKKLAASLRRMAG